MRIIALEEHFVTNEMLGAWKTLPKERQDIAARNSSGSDLERLLFDLADLRIAAMDAAGVDMQVLSLTAPGVQNLDAGQAVSLARTSNDLLAATIRKYPGRFQGLATLPTPSPNEAAAELRRAIVELGLNGAMLFGRTGKRNLDHPDFLPILEAAAALRAPLYIHPQTPALPVREQYYSEFDDELNDRLATAGIGWHYETGIQMLRLILSGILDRLPDLQFILGHWGETILFFLDRIDMLGSTVKLNRQVSDYFRTNISVTPGGVLSERYLRWAIEVLGSDRILFATDYPYKIFNDDGAQRFLRNARISDVNRERIACTNWERLCYAIKRPSSA